MAQTWEVITELVDGFGEDLEEAEVVVSYYPKSLKRRDGDKHSS